MVSSGFPSRIEPTDAEQGRAEEGGLSSDGVFEALVDEAPAILWSADAEGETNYVSGRWRLLTGVGPFEGWSDAIHPDDIGELIARWDQCVASGELYENEHRIRMADGAWRRFLVRARPVRKDDAILRWVGSMTDIEDLVRGREAADEQGAVLARLVEQRTFDLVNAEMRVASEAENRRNEQTARRDVDALYGAYIDNTTDGVFVVSVSPGAPIMVATVNRVLESFLGVRREHIQGKKLVDILPEPAVSRLVRKIGACVATAEPLRYEQTIDVEADERVFEVMLAPVRAADGRTVNVVGSARDLTERREAEQKLRQAQKMEAVGQLTGGVAHDFNNLLQVVKGNLDLLMQELGSVLTPTVERRLKDAMAGAERGAKLTRQLLAFSRRQPLTPKPTDVGALVSQMSDLLERSLGETIAISINRDPEPWTALVDPAQLENAVLNLAINARDAMSAGGRLDISVRNAHGGDGKPDFVEIVVADAGSGMTPAVLARVFEPFFSTKPEGRGTGLGLPQVQGFIEQSSGSIDIESAPGRGTTVRQKLPRSTAPAVAEAEPTRPGLNGRGERILLLEDDDAVRRAVRDLLLSLGYEVFAAGSTREAQAWVDQGERFDLLLSDVVMPGAPTPPDFARAISEKRPDIKVLFMSGYAEDVIVHQGRVDADVHLLEKPYRKEDLALRLRELLDRTKVDADAAPAGPRRVLLVEDEPLIAMGLSDLLSSLGYEVVEAGNATAAKTAFVSGDPFDVVLTDLGLPDLDGEKLAGWFRAERPGVPIIFSTGRDDFRASRDLVEGGPVGVLTKPFDSVTLRDALAGCF